MQVSQCNACNKSQYNAYYDLHNYRFNAMNLYDETRQMFLESELTIVQASKDTGISRRWWSYLRAGEGDPVFSLLNKANLYLKEYGMEPSQ